MISKIHRTLSANQKRDVEFNVLKLVLPVQVGPLSGLVDDCIVAGLVIVGGLVVNSLPFWKTERIAGY